MRRRFSSDLDLDLVHLSRAASLFLTTVSLGPHFQVELPPPAA
jgi:hypothetical protein